MSYHEDFEPYDEPCYPRRKRIKEGNDRDVEHKPCTFTGGGDADECTHD